MHTLTRLSVYLHRCVPSLPGTLRGARTRTRSSMPTTGKVWARSAGCHWASRGTDERCPDVVHKSVVQRNLSGLFAHSFKSPLTQAMGRWVRWLIGYIVIQLRLAEGWGGERGAWAGDGSKEGRLRIGTWGPAEKQRMARHARTRVVSVACFALEGRI
jgi:hypothetical protein